MQKFVMRPQSGIPFKQNLIMPNINQQGQNQIFIEPARIASKPQPFDNERLKEDIFQLKNQNLQFIKDNTYYKQKISAAEEEIKKYERLFEDIKNTGVIKIQGQQQVESAGAFLVTQIKQEIKDLKFELNYKDDEMNKMRKNIKIVKLNELEAEKKQYQDESIKLKHLLDQALDQQMQTGNQTENQQVLEEKYIQENQELASIQQINEEFIQKLQEQQIISQSHQARLAKVISFSDECKKKLIQKEGQIQKLKTDYEIILQEKFKQQEQFEKQKSRGNSIIQQPKKIQNKQSQNTISVAKLKDQEIIELEEKYKQIFENYEIFQKEQKIIEKQELGAKAKIVTLKEEIQKQELIRQNKLQEKQLHSQQQDKEEQVKTQELRKKQKDIELEKRIQQRQKLQQQKQDTQQQQQQQPQQNQQAGLVQQQGQQNNFQNEIIIERDQEQTEDFEQLEMQQQIQDSLKFLGEDIKYRLILNNIPQNQISNFFFNESIEAQETTNVEELSKILSSPPFNLENDALMLLCAFLISDQFPIDFENINILKETNEKVFEKLAFLIADYEILDKQSANLLKQNFINLINQEQVKDLFKQLQQQEEQLFKFDIQAGLKQFEIDISEKELDFIMVQILAHSGKQSLADLQFTDLFATFTLKTKQKGKKKKKKSPKKNQNTDKQNPDEARYFENELI